MSDSPIFEQNAVSLAVWPWAQPKTVRTNGKGGVFLQAAIPLAVSAFLYFRAPFAHAQTIAKVVLGVAVVLLIIGFAAPVLFKKIEKFVWGFVRWVGIAMSWLLLVPLFYTFFFGARILLTLRGKDPLHRKLEPAASTYWVTREHNADPRKSIRRQF